jgi:RNA polymerase sigma-70 factor (ECF subfamily)
LFLQPLIQQNLKYPDLENEVRLVKLLTKGNILAFNTLYKEYSSRLYRFAFGYLKSQDAAEELVQEVFTKIWEKRADLKKELSFKSFLFTIAFNIIKKHFRTKTYLAAYLKENISNDLDMQTTDKITFDSLNKYLVEIVDRMPERRREIFIKSRFEGVAIIEIAEKMGISHKTVENQLTEALRFIRTNLKKESISVILFCALVIL